MHWGAPYDSDGGATFCRQLAERGYTCTQFREKTMVSRSTLARLTHGRPISQGVRLRVVAFMNAVPVDERYAYREAV